MSSLPHIRIIIGFIGLITQAYFVYAYRTYATSGAEFWAGISFVIVTEVGILFLLNDFKTYRNYNHLLSMLMVGTLIVVLFGIEILASGFSLFTAASGEQAKEKQRQIAELSQNLTDLRSKQTACGNRITLCSLPLQREIKAIEERREGLTAGLTEKDNALLNYYNHFWGNTLAGDSGKATSFKLSLVFGVVLQFLTLYFLHTGAQAFSPSTHFTTHVANASNVRQDALEPASGDSVLSHAQHDLRSTVAVQPTCENCGKAFERRVAWQRFCSDSCRTEFHAHSHV